MIEWLGTTPSQTVGPFLSLGLAWPDGPYAVLPDDAAAIRIEGYVLDGDGDPVPDGMVETWQQEPPRFGRSLTDPLGEWWVITAKPRALPGQAPHIDVSVFARGLLNRLVTRIYFPDEAANASDPVLCGVPEARRSTLVANHAGDGTLRFDIRLQGDHETVFFSV
jgi:protocatechuate 3,4-dioxygenase, alpha subunit